MSAGVPDVATLIEQGGRCADIDVSLVHMNRAVATLIEQGGRCATGSPSSGKTWVAPLS